MRIADSEHTARPWRIHEIAPDFELEDVWAYRTPGAGPDDFPVMLDALRARGGLNNNPPLVRFIFAVRWKLGAVFGWDDPERGLAKRVESLVSRLPSDLRQDAAGEKVPNTPFTMVYELPDESASELANNTVHTICHLGWVPTDSGDYELRMAALVRPNGRLGRLYMAGIKPFRYAVIYPALTRKWERAWRDRHSYTGVGEPVEPAPAGAREAGMVRWAGRLIVFFGAAHTLGALAAEGAARHAGAWLRGDLWGDDLGAMSPANSAYWLSVNSFGPPLVVIGLMVLWLDRRGITPPPFIAWTIGAWTLADTVVAGPGVGQGLILLAAAGLLLAAQRRKTHRHEPSPIRVA